MAGWMINDDDPARLEIADRASKLKITGNPDSAAHALGQITLADGNVVDAHVLHAVDVVATNAKYVAAADAQVVVINRLHDPGKGKPALPGGMLDPTKNGVETPVEAAIREAWEETDIDLKGAKATPIGARNMNRPFDVRVAKGNGLEEKYGIKDRDVFMVSTQVIRFDVPDLEHTTLVAGDDAEPDSVHIEKLSSLSRDKMGIPDHFDLIVAAVPECFAAKRPSQKTTPRPHRR